MKKILSIDGGGIRGIIPAMVLAEIETKSGKAIGSSFDLLAGTSTGGILALCLAIKDERSGAPKFSAKDLVDIYQKRGKEIFPRSLWKGVSSVAGIADEKYSHKGLEKVLEDYFDGEPLGASLTKVLVTSYDIQDRIPVFFKSWKEDHKHVEMRYVARATSAAPTYFEPALVPVGSAMKALIDGGVFVNNPSVSAYAEAIRIFPDEKEFFLVSLGTGQLNRPIAYSEAKDWGMASWLVPLMSCMFDGMSDAADYQVKQFLGDNYVRLQVSLANGSDDMDDVTNGNMENLKADARQLIKTHTDEIKKICSLI
jgi:hypothetical protein